MKVKVINLLMNMKIKTLFNNHKILIVYTNYALLGFYLSGLEGINIKKKIKEVFLES